MRAQLQYVIQHEQNSFWRSSPSYPPSIHYCSDVVYQRRGAWGRGL